MAARVSDLAPQRQARILEEVQRVGAVRVSELTHALGVSDMTIRRDLEVLSRQGLLAKVHGGATATIGGPSADEPGFEVKSVRHPTAKQSIATAVAQLVKPGSAIALTGGTTTWTVSRYLLDVPHLTVVTNSIRVADVLHQQHRSDRTVVLTGGVRTPSDALVGPVAVSTIRSLHVDLAIMGVHGVDPEAGLTTPNLSEAETNRAFCDATRHLVVVADHSKWGLVGLSQIAPLAAVDVLVTDDGISESAEATLSEMVGELVIAGRSKRRSDELKSS
jgi:DeoR/GlpR family transcriptional regulator of sugar metabolism